MGIEICFQLCSVIIYCWGMTFNNVMEEIDDDYNDIHNNVSHWELFKRALGFRFRALKCTLLIIFNLFLLACTIGLLVPFILYLREEASTSIPLIVMFAVCSCSCVCFNCIMCTYFGCLYVSIEIGKYFAKASDE